MALINCPFCNTEVQDALQTCPVCGHELREATQEETRTTDKEVKSGTSSANAQDNAMLKIPSIMLTVAFALSLCYLLLMYGTIKDLGWGDAESIAINAIAVSLFVPHLVCAALGMIFAIVSKTTRKREYALFSAITNILAVLFFLMRWKYFVVQITLCFMAFVMLKEPQDN